MHMCTTSSTNNRLSLQNKTDTPTHPSKKDHHSVQTMDTFQQPENRFIFALSFFSSPYTNLLGGIHFARKVTTSQKAQHKEHIAKHMSYLEEKFMKKLVCLLVTMGFLTGCSLSKQTRQAKEETGLAPVKRKMFKEIPREPISRKQVPEKQTPSKTKPHKQAPRQQVSHKEEPRKREIRKQTPRKQAARKQAPYAHSSIGYEPENKTAFGLGGKSGRGFGLTMNKGAASDFGNRSARKTWKKAKVRRGKLRIKGTFKRYKVIRVARMYWFQMRYCYERELRNNPTIKGKATFTWHILKDGSVSKPKVLKSTLNSKAVEHCVIRRIIRWTFSHPKKGIVQVKYNFSFKTR